MSILDVLIDLAPTYISNEAKRGETERTPKKDKSFTSGEADYKVD
jgi:hypothetical protein